MFKDTILQNLSYPMVNSVPNTENRRAINERIVVLENK